MSNFEGSEQRNKVFLMKFSMSEPIKWLIPPVVENYRNFCLMISCYISCLIPFKGSSAGNRYSPQFVKAAKLLHWNGHFKPWGRTASFADVWEKWYIPDPSGKFNLIRRHSEIYTAH